MRMVAEAIEKVYKSEILIFGIEVLREGKFARSERRF